MRKLLVLPLVSLVWITPALAAHPPQNPAAGQATEDQDTANFELPSVEASIQSRLALAGFTDIEMVPTSFLVRAKDRAGNPVMLMLSPEGITGLDEPADQDRELDESSSGKRDESASGATPQPRTAFPGATDAE
jgi:hypothetical protein